MVQRAAKPPVTDQHMEGPIVLEADEEFPYDKSWLDPEHSEGQIMIGS